MGLARPKDQTYLKQLFHAGIAAVDARGSVARCLQNGGALFQIDRVRPDRSFPENIWILGAGKATAAMASATEEFLVEDYPDRYAGGLVVVKDGHGLSLERVRCLEAGHPLPDERGEKAASALLRLAESADHGDLILFLLSGGASALLPAPAGCITLSDKIMLTDTLLRCGAGIHEINALRKHCSRLKGGRLVQAGRKAAWVTLAISDVPGDSPESIGSGPTVGDSSTLTDCWNILKKYDLEESLPERILQHLNQESSETPKPDDTLFSSSRYEIVARNGDAVRAARQRAEELAFSVEPDQRFVIEDVAEAAGLWSELKRHSDSALKKPYIIICGGEPTVKVKGSGKGGRNMELALRLAASLTGKFTFLSAGTDGTDGPTDAAGAFADETTLSRAEGVGLDLNDYLDRNDSYGFFQKMGDLFVTGPTGTNVMDLEMLVVWE